MAENTNGSKNAGDGSGEDALKDFWASDDSSLFDDSDVLPLIDEDKLWNEVLESYRNKNPDSYSAKRTVEVAKEVGIRSEPSVSARPRSFDAAASREDTNDISAPKASAASKNRSDTLTAERTKSAKKEAGNKDANSAQRSQVSASRPADSVPEKKTVAEKKSSKGPDKSSGGKSQASRIQKTTSNGTVINDQKSKAGKNSKKRSSGKKYKDTRTRGQKIAKFIVCLLIWIIVIVLCCGAFKLGYDIFYDTPMDSSDLTKIEITIDGYETDTEIGEFLLENDLIDNMFIFKIRCLVYDSDYVAGTYSISRSYNTEKILNILAGYDYSDGTLDE